MVSTVGSANSRVCRILSQKLNFITFFRNLGCVFENYKENWQKSYGLEINEFTGSEKENNKLGNFLIQTKPNCYWMKVWNISQWNERMKSINDFQFIEKSTRIDPKFVAFFQNKKKKKKIGLLPIF